MTILNPLGLIGLLSLPLIIIFHYFRSQTKVMKIGGLHLWEFARRKQPVGHRWHRLVISTPLILELISALILTLIISELSWTPTVSSDHIIVVLDDSISMQATDNSGISAADKAVSLIEKRYGADVYWTIIRAGIVPGLLAGPRATTIQTQDKLRTWVPLSQGVSQVEAVRFALQFADPGQKVLYLTDNDKTDLQINELIETNAMGVSCENVAIVFADRFRISKTTDRILAMIQYFGSESTKEIQVKLVSSNTVLNEKIVQVHPNKLTRVDFEVDLLNLPISISIQEDALAIDNKVMLVSNSPKQINVRIDLDDEIGIDAVRAYRLVDNVSIVDSILDSRLLFTNSATSIAYGTNILTVVQIPPDSPANLIEFIEQGFLFDRTNPIMAGLTFEGIVWPLDREFKVLPNEIVILAAEGYPLITSRKSLNGLNEFRLNLVLSYSNIGRTPIWPILLYNLAEETRSRIPGLKRTNYRLGERIDFVVPNLSAKANINWRYSSTNKSVDYPRLPSEIVGLEQGLHRLELFENGKKTEISYSFGMNVFAPIESDLQQLSADQTANFRRVKTPNLYKVDDRPTAFYTLMSILILLLASLWYFQEQRFGL